MGPTVLMRTCGLGTMPLEHAVSGMGVWGFVLPVPVLAVDVLAVEDAELEAEAFTVLATVEDATLELGADAVAFEPPVPPVVEVEPPALPVVERALLLAPASPSSGESTQPPVVP